MGHSLSNAKTRPSKGVIYNMSHHSQIEDLKSNIGKCKCQLFHTVAMNSSASTNVLRTNHKIINIRNISRDKKASIGKNMTTVDKSRVLQDVKFMSSGPHDKSS